MKQSFVRRAKGTPCPICEHQSWCTVTEDGTVVRCMRVQSDRESAGTDGSLGWLHDGAEKPVPIERTKTPEKKLTVAEVTERAKAAFEHAKANETRQSLAASLGVSVASLEALRVGYGCDYDGQEWSSWPCRDARGSVVGISRRYADGSKKTMQGTRTGLYYPRERQGLQGPLLIVEGGSDVAAAYTVGLPAIGRPSNTGGVQWIRQLIGKRRAVVVGERDESPERRGKLSACPADCPGCGVCWPGYWGAKVVSEHLKLPYVMPPPGVKDFRELVRVGCWWDLLRECRL